MRKGIPDPPLFFQVPQSDALRIEYQGMGYGISKKKGMGYGVGFVSYRIAPSSFVEDREQFGAICG